MVNNLSADVIIIGGSFAGLSAALALARSGRSVAVFDNDDACNKSSEKAYNILTNDGLSPQEIKSKAIKNVMNYKSASFYTKTVSRIAEGDPLSIETVDGATYSSKAALLCTGMADIIPDIPGFADCWGKSIIHCPYCHAYERQARHVSMFGHTEEDIVLAGLLKTWNKDVTLLTNGHPVLAEQHELLQKQQITIKTQSISALCHNDGQLRAVAFDDGTSFEVKDIFVNPAAVQRSSIGESAGCELLENQLIKIDDFHRTTVTGVYAAGDCCTSFRTISIAIASGTKAGIFIHQDLHKMHLKKLLSRK
ncbi:NAD(P)/FAD-dependent oxidoreductase [Parapedobacter deserti]|uniref:NAD(P)/FAD-dependent oxidoreductase n=1 Tax=Parapedobacter deserti TaxID=1912957 RepID=A0ABV7JTA8_9SPHI